MKKGLKISLIIVVIVLVFLIQFFYPFFDFRKGDVSKVNIINKESEFYSKEEITEAIDVILNDFKESCKGCTLKEISYIGDDENNNYIDWSDRNNKEEVIVLISTFSTSETTTEQGLNANDLYQDWNWILVRNKNEKWIHVDHGY